MSSKYTSNDKRPKIVNNFSVQSCACLLRSKPSDYKEMFSVKVGIGDGTVISETDRPGAFLKGKQDLEPLLN